MFYKHSEDGFRPVIPGIQLKTLVYGEKSSLTAFHLAKDSLLPRHSHPHEQTGYLISGHMRLTVGTETLDAFPGDSWCVPGGVEHFAEIVEDSFAIEVFSPVREDYLPR
ncbi:MAG: cupin domain-containing protein [Anaerolineaceae bacterium]|nr:cupin domain-containing protein [Anaerolineaceae bacterium]